MSDIALYYNTLQQFQDQLVILNLDENVIEKYSSHLKELTNLDLNLNLDLNNNYVCSHRFDRSAFHIYIADLISRFIDTDPFMLTLQWIEMSYNREYYITLANTYNAKMKGVLSRSPCEPEEFAKSILFELFKERSCVEETYKFLDIMF